MQLSVATGAIMNTHTIKTTIRLAFENIKVKASANTVKGQDMAGQILNSLHGKAGEHKRNDWNSNLSFKTAMKLGMADGCTNPYAKMPIDAMVQG